MNHFKQKLGLAAMPMARIMVKTVPPGPMRERVWRWGRWRSRDFVVEANGIEIAGNTLDLIQGYLYWFGVWEPNLTQFIKRRMSESPDRTFVDVGANIGYFTTLVARHYPRSHVVSIEAFPSIVDKLRSNVKRNALTNVRIVAEAVSDVAGTLELYYAGGLNEGGTTSVRGKHKSPGVQVSCRPLPVMLTDDEMATARLVKIDVEGAESRVVEGLAPKLAMLARDVEFIVEISEGSPKCSEFIFDTFDEHGFCAYELDNDYDPHAYLYPCAPSVPKRLYGRPCHHTDA
jgi:FkbM family methyltransferase